MRIYLLIVLITLGFVSKSVQGEKDKVNSKLDFNISDEDSNASTTTSRGRNGSGSKSSPKIQGVRVTVDTGKTKKSAESGSKESVEFVDNKNKKKIGIHTDITFEITDDSNSTNSGQNDKDDSDASVPVYRGRGGSSATTHRPHGQYYPKTHHWSANQPSGHHSGSGHRQYPIESRYPQRNDEEIYRGGGGGGGGAGGSNNNWSGFLPITTVWTTERSYYEPYRPNSVGGYKNYENSDNSRWKPCVCVSAIDSRNRRDDSRTVGYIQVDDKLDGSFTSHDGKRK